MSSNPLQRISVDRMSAAVCQRVAKLTAPVFAVAVIINIPKFFETEFVEVSQSSPLPLPP